MDNSPLANVNYQKGNMEVKITLRETKQGWFLEGFEVIKGTLPLLQPMIDAQEPYATKKELILDVKEVMKSTYRLDLSSKPALTRKKVLVILAKAKMVLMQRFPDAGYGEAEFAITQTQEGVDVLSVTDPKGVCLYSKELEAYQWVKLGKPFIRGDIFMELLSGLWPELDMSSSKFISRPEKNAFTALLVWEEAREGFEVFLFNVSRIRALT